MVQEIVEVSKAEIFIVIGTLSAVIAILWKIIMAWHKSEQERLRKYELMQEESTRKINTLTGEFNYLKGRIEGVEQLSNSVLKRINEAINDRNSNTGGG